MSRQAAARLPCKARSLACVCPVPSRSCWPALPSSSAPTRGSTMAHRRWPCGSTLHASAKGSRRGDRLDFDWKLGLANLSAIAPALSGPVQAQGRVQGVADDLNVSADASGDVATKDFAHGPVTLTLRARGLPAKPVGKIDAHGTLAGAPLQLSASFEKRSDGVLRSTIGAADWK